MRHRTQCTVTHLPLAIGIMLVTACATPSQPQPPASSAPQPAGLSPRSAPKVLTLAVQREPAAFADLASVGGGTSGGAVNAQKIPHDSFVAEFDDERYRPQLAVEIPSIEQGTWRVNPDGTMDLTWRFHPNARWHDGTPFTAHDAVFSFQVYTDPDIPVSGTQRSLMESATALDAHTLVMRWAQTYVSADEGFAGTLMPRHLLQELYTTDKTAFVNSPRFTTEFVGLGPYRLVRWEQGSHMEFTRFDDYYRGRPPLDAVIVRFIGDPNTMVATILAGTIDAIVPFGGPDLETAFELKRRWEGTGHQVRADATGALRLLEIQYRPEYARPRHGLAASVPVRQGLFHAVDRQALVDVVSLGLAPIADSYYIPTHELRSHLQIPQYPYDPARAQQFLAQAGWTRGADGILAHQPSGERFEAEVWGRSEGKTEREITIIAEGWKAVGGQVGIHLVPSARQADREYQSLYPTVLITEPTGSRFYKDRLHSSIIPSPANRWSGFNRGGYVDPRMDAVLERLNITIDPRDRVPLHRELLQLMIGEVATMPLYWLTVPMISLKGVKSSRFVRNNAAWDFFEWDKEV